MSLLSQLKKILSVDTPDPLLLPDALVYSRIDQLAIEKVVNLQSRATEDGKANRPPPDATTLSSTEEEVIHAILELVRPNLQNYDSQLQAYKNRRASLDPLGIAAQYQGKGSLQINEFKAQIAQESGSLFLLRQALKDIEEDWKKFKEKWGIIADPPLPTNSVRAWTLLGIFILVEAAINGFVIGPYLAGGVQDGALIAIFFQ